MRLGRTTLVSIIAAATLAGGSGAALAGWGVPATGAKLTGQAGTLPTGPTPTAKPAPNGVKISWTPAQIPDVTYRINRHAHGTPDAGVCLTAASSCLDSGVGTGVRYTYTVRLVVVGWQGSEGASSAGVTVAAPAPPPGSQLESSPAPTTSAEATVPSPEPSTQPSPEQSSEPTPKPSEDS
jgi:hypothetical protein